jgi:DNA-binding YbaB/EbfC family protein
MEVSGEAGGGLVKVTMTGKHAVRRIQIDPSLLDDREMLEDIVTAAVNDAVNRVAAAMQERMSEMTAGIPLPPGIKLPF